MLLFLAVRAVAGNGLCFCAVLCFFTGWLVSLGPTFLDSGSQPSLNGSPGNLHTRLVWGQALKPTFETFFYPTLKNLAGKTSNFADISTTCRQWRARNFETAQNIDKQNISLVAVKSQLLPVMQITITVTFNPM